MDSANGCVRDNVTTCASIWRNSKSVEKGVTDCGEPSAPRPGQQKLLLLTYIISIRTRIPCAQESGTYPAGRPWDGVNEGGMRCVGHSD